MSTTTAGFINGAVMSKQAKLAEVRDLEDEAKNYRASFTVCATYGVCCEELLGFAKDNEQKAKLIREEIEKLEGGSKNENQ